MLAARAFIRAVPRVALSRPAAPLAVGIPRVSGLLFRQFAQAADDKSEGVSTAADEPEEAAAAGAGGAAPAGDERGLKEENTKLKASVAELNSARLRLLAEMENVRRIATRDVEQARAYALQSFAKKLLDVADNLNRAVTAFPAEARVKKEGNEVVAVLYEGIAATEKEMLKTFAGAGIEPFGKQGEKFDPNRHEAMMQVPAGEGSPENHVTLVLKPGFTLKDRVLRPAQVAVATKM